MKKTILSAIRLLVVIGVCIQLTFIVLDFTAQHHSVNQLRYQLKKNITCIF
jgi:sensor domain CHASE-containing protein